MKVHLILFSLFVMMGIANAQLENCSRMSKYPKCWQGKTITKLPRNGICFAEQECDKVTKVIASKWGYYTCVGNKGIRFDCSELVEEYGKNLEGERVLVTTPYIDGCHVPGACGPKACVPSWGSGSMSPKC